MNGFERGCLLSGLDPLRKSSLNRSGALDSAMLVPSGKTKKA